MQIARGETDIWDAVLTGLGAVMSSCVSDGDSCTASHHRRRRGKDSTTTWADEHQRGSRVQRVERLLLLSKAGSIFRKRTVPWLRGRGAAVVEASAATQGRVHV